MPSQARAVFSATSSDSTRSGCPVDQAVTRIWHARSSTDGRSSDHHAVVAHQQTALAIEQAGQACAFGLGIGHAAIELIHRDTVEIACGVLVDRWDMGLRQTRHCRGVDRVQMQHRAALRQQAMDLPVDRPGRGIDVGVISTVGIIGIQQQQVTGPDAREMLPLRVEQKLFAIGRHGRAEMVGHRFVHAQMGDDTKGRRQVDARLFFVGYGLRRTQSRLLGHQRRDVGSGGCLEVVFLEQGRVFRGGAVFFQAVEQGLLDRVIALLHTEAVEHRVDQGVGRNHHAVAELVDHATGHGGVGAAAPGWFAGRCCIR